MPAVREAVMLTRSGIPFDVAFGPDPAWRAGLNDVWRVALCIVATELDTGRQFSFANWQFEDP